MFGIISTLENAGLKMLACNLGLQHAVWGLLFVATKNLFYENCPQVENFVVRYLRYASQILHHLKPEKFRQPEKMFRRVQSDVTELNWTETKRQAERAHWSLVDAYVSVVA